RLSHDSLDCYNSGDYLRPAPIHPTGSERTMNHATHSGRTMKKVGLWWQERMPPVYNVLVMLFILSPLAVVIGASFNSGEFTSFPPKGFSLEWYAKVLTDRGFVESMYLSIRIAIAAAGLATVVGVLAAIAINRLDRWFTPTLQFLALGPLILPEVLLALGVLTLLV